MTWRERIQAARERGHFTEEDKTKASSWGTCAVGEHIATGAVKMRLNLTFAPLEIEEPEDERLRMLGCAMGFQGAVTLDQINAAERHLDMIEDRVLELKRAAQ